MRSVPARSIAAVAGVRCTRERRPWRSVRSQPAVTLRASARRAAGSCIRASRARRSGSPARRCRRAGRTYSPSRVSSTDRAAGAPMLRRRSCSFTPRHVTGRATNPFGSSARCRTTIGRPVRQGSGQCDLAAGHGVARVRDEPIEAEAAVDRVALASAVDDVGAQAAADLTRAVDLGDRVGSRAAQDLATGRTSPC